MLLVGSTLSVVEVPVPEVATVVVVLVMITVVQPLSVDDAELVTMLVALVEFEVEGSTLMTTLVSKADEILLVVGSRLE